MILYLSATTLQKLQSFRVHQSKRSFERYGHEDMSVRAERILGHFPFCCGICYAIRRDRCGMQVRLRQ